MQWSAEPNGGFSTAADPDDLCRPLTDDEGFDPAAVNVASQRRDEGSLLNWFERLIRLRKECPELGWGRFQLLATAERAVLPERLGRPRDRGGAQPLRDPVATSFTLDDGERIEALRDLFRHEELRPSADGRVELDLEPYAHRWFRARRPGSASRSRHGMWWQRAVVYQVYPRSFADSDGDGVGDLAGVVAHLDHLNDGTPASSGSTIWLSPFYPSPMADFGYDVADYTGVDPLFGSLADADRLLREAHARGIRVIIDWVPNHTSDRHPWFLASRSSRDDPRRDWYVWRDGRPGRAAQRVALLVREGGAGMEP